MDADERGYLVRPLGVFAEHQAVLVGGVNLWDHYDTWQDLKLPPAKLPRPDYEDETHGYTEYEVEVDGKTIRFLMTEVCNGGYSFYLCLRPLRD